MSTIDPSIPLQARFQQVDPLAEMAQVQSLKNAGLETQINRFKLGEAQRAAQNAKAVQDAIRQGGGDMQKTHELLSRIGDPHAIEMNTMIEQHLATIDKLGVEKLKLKAENDKEAARITSERAGMIANVPDEQISQIYADKKLPEWPSEQELQQKGLTLPTFLSSLIPAEAWNKHITDAAELKIKQSAEARAVAEASKPKYLRSYTNDEGRNVEVFQKEDGTTKEIVLGKVGAAPRTSQLKTPEEEAQAIRITKAGKATSATSSDPKDIAQAIIDGKQQPTLTGLYRDAAPVRAELARKGYDLATATSDWNAVQKHLSTLNGAQQERLRQAVSFTYDSLDNIDQLFDEWKKAVHVSDYRLLNKGKLAIQKQLPGKAGEVAQNLEAQINDLVSELGTVYKGGNASTDETLRLASENLKADWNERTFKAAIGQIRKNLGIRRNSMLTSQPAGVSAASPYNPAVPAPAPTATPVIQKWGRDKNGNPVKIQ